MQITGICPCQVCNGRIEFDSSLFQAGTVTTCPHCGAETTLFISKTPPSSSGKKDTAILPLSPKDVSYIKTICQYCDGAIEFPAHAFGQIASCPHCGRLIALGMPSEPSVGLPSRPADGPTAKPSNALPPLPKSQKNGNFPALASFDISQVAQALGRECGRFIMGLKNRFLEHPTASTKELQLFIQTRLYYYIPRWERLDPSLKEIKPGTFNWSAFFFTIYWMAYRKMYLYTAIIFIVLCVVSAIITNIIIAQKLQADEMNTILMWKLFCSLIVMFSSGRYGNCLYKNHVEAKIREAKRTVTAEYLDQAYRDWGGTSWIGITLLIIWAIVWALVIGVIAFSQAAHQ